MNTFDQSIRLLQRTYYVTFAEEHRHPATREPMEGYYVKIEAEDEEAARFAVFQIFHDDFKFLYTDIEFEQHMAPKGEYAACVAEPFNIPNQTHD